MKSALRVETRKPYAHRTRLFFGCCAILANSRVMLHQAVRQTPVNKDFSKRSLKQCSYGTVETNRLNREKIYTFVLNKKINNIKIIHTDKSKNYGSCTLVGIEIKIFEPRNSVGRSLAPDT
ncbi:hypothetical protein ACVBEH_12630 [Roseateles sp. GG27B]